jgi:hypothetical protein
VATADVEPSRIEPVRHRVAVAKAALALGAVLAFGGALALSRFHNSGHAKQPLRPLAPTRSYLDVVRKQLGSAGSIDPPVTTPAASTHVS